MEMAEVVMLSESMFSHAAKLKMVRNIFRKYALAIAYTNCYVQRGVAVVFDVYKLLALAALRLAPFNFASQNATRPPGGGLIRGNLLRASLDYLKA